MELCSPMDKGPLGIHQVKLVIKPEYKMSVFNKRANSKGSALLYPSLCCPGGEMIVTEIQITIQRSTSWLTTPKEFLGKFSVKYLFFSFIKCKLLHIKQSYHGAFFREKKKNIFP